MLKILFKWVKNLTLLGLLIVLLVLAWDYYVSYQSDKKTYTSVQTIPFKKTALVLGTGKILANGRINYYYKYRIDATAKLYQAKKIKYIIVSGDNGRTDYDEPTQMKEDLIARGIPAKRIFIDYAGFRTLDSVVRADAIFGQNDFTIISQRFHNQRALYIANWKGLNALAFNAKNLSTPYAWKTLLREKLARVKMLIDLIFNKQPKFLGPPVQVG